MRNEDIYTKDRTSNLVTYFCRMAMEGRWSIRSLKDNLVFGVNIFETLAFENSRGSNLFFHKGEAEHN